MNYQVILDENILKDFIRWLPDLKTNEHFYVCLLARRKYCKDIKYIKTDQSQLVRIACRKERIFYKIKQMECPLGSYRQPQDESEIPQDALAVYINPNPRCLVKSTLEGLLNFTKRVVNSQFNNFLPHQEIYSCIQRSCARRVFSSFDIDSKENNTLDKVKEALIGIENYKIIETRGGYHVLVDLHSIKKEVKNTWFKKVAAFSDMVGDKLIPIPGTFQGGWMPRFII